MSEESIRTEGASPARAGESARQLIRRAKVIEGVKPDHLVNTQALQRGLIEQENRSYAWHQTLHLPESAWCRS